MEITPDCVPCLMRRIVFQARLLNNGCEGEAAGAALKAFAEGYGLNRTSTDVATEVHAAAYKAMGKDPYYQMKLTSDEIAGRYIPQLEARYWASAHHLRSSPYGSNVELPTGHHPATRYPHRLQD